MSKMSELSQTIEDLKSAAEALLRAAEVMVYAFGGEEEPAEAEAAQHAPRQPPAQPDVQPKSITLEELRGMLSGLCGLGYAAQVKALIEAYGVKKLQDVDPAQYTVLAAAARELQDKIQGGNNG